MDSIRYTTINHDVCFNFDLSSSVYDLSSVSEIFPDLIEQIADYLDGYRKCENDDN